MKRAAIGLGLTLLACVAAPCAGREFFDIVRELEAAQDDPDAADEARAASSRRLFEEARRALGAARDPADERRNGRALGSYLLRGGSVDTGWKAPRTPGRERDLIDGAVALAGKKPRDAWTKLEPIDPRDAAAEIAGVLALAQARLAGEFDPPQASRRFALARLLAPGGMIEEAALREEAQAALRNGDVARFARLLKARNSRFARVSLAPDVSRALIADFAGAWSVAEPAARRDLEEAADQVPAGARAELWLDVARTAAMSGRSEAVRAALAQLRRPPVEKADDARVRLYEAVAGASTPQGPGLLAAIDTMRLSKDDRMLHVCAATLAQIASAETLAVAGGADEGDERIADGLVEAMRSIDALSSEMRK